VINLADVFELKYDINLDYSKSLKTMEGEIGNFDIKIPIDIDSKDLDKIKKQVDSLEDKPRRISI